jgi:hypothetical protein
VGQTSVVLTSAAQGSSHRRPKKILWPVPMVTLELPVTPEEQAQRNKWAEEGLRREVERAAANEERFQREEAEAEARRRAYLASRPKRV